MASDRILIVDDNPANLKLVSFLLQSRGYETRTAESAQEVLSMVGHEVPELILMDIQLPGMDGLTLTRKLRANPETADVVIVALTAYAMKGDEEKALSAGCDDYITKPIDTRTLPDRIAGYLARRRKGRKLS